MKKLQAKAFLASVFLVIGMFLLLEGSRVTLSGRAIEIDLLLVTVGAVLTIAYPMLIGDYFEIKFKTPRIISFMPMFLMLGIVLIFQAITRSLGSIDKIVFIVTGIALVAAPILVTYKATRGKGRK